MATKYYNVCPKCGSTNLESIYLASPILRSRILTKRLQEGKLGMENPSVYICKDCEYYGICPEVEITKIKEFKKAIKDLPDTPQNRDNNFDRRIVLQL